MLISVIVPVYNLESIVKRCLLSLLRQTYHNIEIICINDGSTDNSQNILDQYARQDNRIRLISKCNEGLPMARQSGQQQATGDFIIHVDGDDYLEPDAIERLYERQKATEADIVMAHYYMEQEDGSQRVLCQDYDFDILKRAEFLKILLNYGKYFLWGKLIRRGLYEHVTIPAEIHYTEDMIAMVQLANLSRHVALLNYPIYHYIQRKGSFTHVLSKKSFQDWYQAIRLTNDYCQSLPDVNQFQQLILQREVEQADIYLRHIHITGYYRTDLRILIWKMLKHYRSGGSLALTKLPASNRLFFLCSMISQRLSALGYNIYLKVRSYHDNH